MKCTCGSNAQAENVYDMRGIYVARVCDECREEKLSCFRQDIFEDPDYWHDEPLDEE